MISAERCQALGLAHPPKTKEIASLAARSGLAATRLTELLHPDRAPLACEFLALSHALAVSDVMLRLAFGVIDSDLVARLQQNAVAVANVVGPQSCAKPARVAPQVAFETTLGKLYRADCMDVLASMESDCVDVVFADPPFNLKKFYRSGIDDDLRESIYVQWCKAWLEECCRVLKPGGSLFFWNLPKWSGQLSSFLNERLRFRHWIAVDIKYSLPIAGRLYPSHYGLLYYVKGDAPKTFAPDRMPMEICPKCGADLKDYGGYKAKMNPKGVNLADVWYDIEPVRHRRYKKRTDANELSVRLLDRIIEMSTVEGDVVFDPFGGSGTTYAVAELKRRRWVGVELGPIDQVIARLADLSDEREYLHRIRRNYNALFPPDAYALRKRRGLWTCDDFHGSAAESAADSLF